jgi:1,3-beta-glucanosyltransferase GAS1
MYKALTCVPSDEVDDDNIGELFGVLCGLSDGAQCDGIAANGTTGDYGAYGMCNPTQQLGWALNNYYNTQSASGNTAACAFSGSATTQSFVSPTGSCSSLIAQAGADGTGTVTSAPSGTGSSGSSGSSSAGSGSGSSSSSSGVAAPGFGTISSINLGAYQFAIYAIVSVITGAGMILL